MDSTLKNVFDSFQGKKEELIPILQKVQERYGYLPEDAMLEVSRFARVPESTVYGVATFYAQFRFTPIGENRIMVCRGTACHVKGSVGILEEIERKLGIKEGETTPDGRYSLETVACIGCCSLAPCVMINKKVHANLTPQKVAKLFKKD
ncbi:MAG: NADH-quinone oxidoreductase subunit NuoE [Spirochaetes bacterium]|nr:NADH-quinone oxidoreductase subunit NuoE [Spirochaetota bacterium]